MGITIESDSEEYSRSECVSKDGPLASAARGIARKSGLPDLRINDADLG